MKNRAFAIVWLMLSVSFVGCMSDSSDPAMGLHESGLSDIPSDPWLRGQVLDGEFLPVEDAYVLLLPGEVEAQTAANGTFRFGPLIPGEYTLVVTAEGYAEASTTVQVADDETNEVVVQMQAVAADVPYHLTEHYVQFFFCSWAAIDGPSSPCLITENFVHTGAAGDQDRFQFTIPAAGLADLLWESDWPEQSTGKEIRRALTTGDVTSSSGVGAVTVWFLIQPGPAVLRAFLIPDEINYGGNTEFDGAEGMTYTATATVSDDNNTVPYFGLMINQRVQNYVTYFFNRDGPRTFTGVPDS